MIRDVPECAHARLRSVWLQIECRGRGSYRCLTSGCFRPESCQLAAPACIKNHLACISMESQKEWARLTFALHKVGAWCWSQCVVS